ncbi:MAG: thiamine diphosphokinase [Lachnospiraceae bacterium]
MRTLIVTGGAIQDAFALDYLRQEEFSLKIAVDHGADFFYRNKICPDYVVGDFDSASERAITAFSQMDGVTVLSYPSEKNETDTEIGIGIAIEKKSTEVVILGATGTRMDHVLGNIHLLGRFMKEKIKACLVDEFNRIQVVDQPVILNRSSQFGDYVSILAFSPEVKEITLTGFKYPLSKYNLSCFLPIGISNEIMEETAEIYFTEGILLVTESKDSCV